MLEANKAGILEMVSTNDNTIQKKFDFDIKKYTNLKVLIGKNIGDKFILSEITKKQADKDKEYQIGRFTPKEQEEKILEKNHGIIKYKPTGSNQDRLIQELIKKLRKFGFEGFIHTTEIENFKSIVKRGKLIPRSNLERNFTKFEDKAIPSVIFGTNDFVKCCCRFYYAYNTPTNYTANYKQKVSLVFDECLAYKPEVWFAPRNAYYGQYSNNISEVLRYDWEGVFERGGYSFSKYSKLCADEVDEKTKQKINAIRNAEFLFRGEVSISYIKKIVVYDRKTYNEMRIICDDVLFSKVVLREGK